MSESLCDDGEKPKPRLIKWASGEEEHLIDLIADREEELFGSLKGPSGTSTAQKRKVIWGEIQTTLSGSFTSGTRDIKTLKKKYFNIKQRSKEKLDERRKMRQKTGGGPADPPLTAAEEVLVRRLDGRPMLTGLDVSIDTDEEPGTSKVLGLEPGPCTVSDEKDVKVTTDKPRSTSKCLKRKVDEANLANIELDNQRIQGQLALQEEKRRLFVSQRFAYDSMRIYYEQKLQEKYNVVLQHED